MPVYGLGWHQQKKENEEEKQEILKRFTEGKVIYDPIYGVLVDTETGEVYSTSMIPFEYEPTKVERFGTRFKSKEEFVHHSPLSRSLQSRQNIYIFLDSTGYIKKCREHDRIDLDKLLMTTNLSPSTTIRILKDHGCRPGKELPKWTEEITWKNKQQAIAIDLYYKIKRDLNVDPCNVKGKIVDISKQISEKLGLQQKYVQDRLYQALRMICPEKVQKKYKRPRGRWKQICDKILNANTETLKKIAEEEGISMETVYVWRYRCKKNKPS